MEVDGRVGETGPRDPGSEVNMVSCMEEILYKIVQNSYLSCLKGNPQHHQTKELSRDEG